MVGLSRVEAVMHRTAGAGAPPFTPASLSDLLWWHDGDLSTKTTSGTNYTQWDDLSGNARHWVQATTTLAPNTGRTINGIIALDFDGTEFMMMSIGGGITTVAHIFAVLVVDVVAASDYIHEAGAFSGNTGWWLRQGAANAFTLQLADDAIAVDTLNASGNVFVVGTSFRIEARFSGAGTMGVRVAAGTEATATATNGGCLNPQIPSLFAHSSGVNLQDGAIAFSCAYSTIKAGTDLTNLRTYINTRFGT